jgi:Tol biopolymer transport system component
MSLRAVLKRSGRKLMRSCIIGLGFICVLASPAWGQGTCQIFQITSAAAGDSFRPNISSDGSHIAFDSPADLSGQNADGNREIFLFDGSGIAQITSSTEDDNFMGSVDSDASHVAFYGRFDFTGQNSDGNTEVYLYDGSSISQITVTVTSGGPQGPSLPHLDADGSHIAFRSDADIGGHNPDGSSEIVLYNGSTFFQITDVPSGAFNGIAIDEDGSHVAFQGPADPVGQNLDANAEVFLYDGSSITQVTNTTGGGNPFENISLDSDGSHLAFQFNVDVTGQNPDESWEIFLFDGSDIQQITNSLSGGSLSPSLDDDGSHLAFHTAGGQIVLYDGAGFQILADGSPLFAGAPSVDGDGSHVAFYSSADLTGGNPEGNYEIFLAVCEPIVLTTQKAGSGSGTVASNPLGIDCGGTCSAAFAFGTEVELRATASPGSTFTGWSGAGCSGTGPCTVTMTGSHTVTGEFDDPTVCGPDPFEVDDSCHGQGIGLGAPQVRTLCDEDWGWFVGKGGATYRIETSNLSAGTDTTLAVHHACGPQLGFNDDFFGLDSRIEWTPFASEFVDVRVRSFGNSYGSAQDYTLTVTCIANCDCPLHLSLSNQTVSATETYKAAETITAGNGFNIINPGDVTFHAGARITLEDGFSVGPASSFRAITDPVPSCP